MCFNHRFYSGVSSINLIKDKWFHIYCFAFTSLCVLKECLELTRCAASTVIAYESQQKTITTSTAMSTAVTLTHLIYINQQPKGGKQNFFFPFLIIKYEIFVYKKSWWLLQFLTPPQERTFKVIGIESS